VDVNLVASDLPTDLRRQTTSLRIELGRPVPRAELAVALLRELDDSYDRVRTGGFEQWRTNGKRSAPRWDATSK